MHTAGHMHATGTVALTSPAAFERQLGSVAADCLTAACVTHDACAAL